MISSLNDEPMIQKFKNWLILLTKSLPFTNSIILITFSLQFQFIEDLNKEMLSILWQYTHLLLESRLQGEDS